MKKWVAVLMGSDSDFSVMKNTAEELKTYQVDCEVRVMSAHRTPEDVVAYIKDAEERGCGVFVAAAGMAAHLAGVVASQTVKPVIGVPIDASLQGMDSLLSTVQMPPGVPVATVAIGKAGAKNAAILAVQILAVQDEQLMQALRTRRQEQVEIVREKNKKVQHQLEG